MTNSSEPVLTLFVSAKSETKSSWTLDPQGRDSFRIVIVCGSAEINEACSRRPSAA
jgi:hypothetical protein